MKGSVATASQPRQKTKVTNSYADAYATVLAKRHSERQSKLEAAFAVQMHKLDDIIARHRHRSASHCSRVELPASLCNASPAVVSPCTPSRLLDLRSSCSGVTCSGARTPSPAVTAVRHRPAPSAIRSPSTAVTPVRSIRKEKSHSATSATHPSAPNGITSEAYASQRAARHRIEADDCVSLRMPSIRQQPSRSPRWTSEGYASPLHRLPTLSPHSDEHDHFDSNDSVEVEAERTRKHEALYQLEREVIVLEAKRAMLADEIQILASLRSSDQLVG